MRHLHCRGLHGTLLVGNVWQAEIQSQSLPLRRRLGLSSHRTEVCLSQTRPLVSLMLHINPSGQMQR